MSDIKERCSARGRCRRPTGFTQLAPSCAVSRNVRGFGPRFRSGEEADDGRRGSNLGALATDRGRAAPFGAIGQSIIITLEPGDGGRDDL